MQNMPRNYTVKQGKNTDDRVKKKTYLCGQTGHRGCYVIKKLAFLDLKCKMFHSKSHEQNLSINSFFIQVLPCLLLSDQFFKIRPQMSITYHFQLCDGFPSKLQESKFS